MVGGGDNRQQFAGGNGAGGDSGSTIPSYPPQYAFEPPPSSEWPYGLARRPLSSFYMSDDQQSLPDEALSSAMSLIDRLSRGAGDALIKMFPPKGLQPSQLTRDEAETARIRQLLMQLQQPRDQPQQQIFY